MKFYYSTWFAYLLNILLPGLGHWFWNEKLFGLFVFLITAIASALFFVSFLINLSSLAKFLMLILPVLFYFFTFVDLHKSIAPKRAGFSRTKKYALSVLSVGILFQLLVPLAPTNFMIRNLPKIEVIDNNSLSPFYSKDEVLLINPLSYRSELFFFDRSFFHTLPNRFDIVNFKGINDENLYGMVIGLRSEEIEIWNGGLVINGVIQNKYPQLNFGAPLENTYRTVGQSSILIGTFSFGQINKLYETELENCIGKVSNLF